MTTTYPADWYWWHKAILDSLRECGPLNAWAIASNTRSQRGDTARWVDQLIEWGMVREVAPMWEGLPESVKWVELSC